MKVSEFLHTAGSATMRRHFHSFMERHFLGRRLSRHSTTFHNALFLTPHAMPTAPGAVILYEKLHAVWMRVPCPCILLFQMENLVY